ncbi:MAG: efflux RND transporter permease subunit [Thermodesulfobacteriota bacterium]
MMVSDTAVRQRVTVLVLAALILVFGLYCYQALPRESDPDVTVPNVFISTRYRGVSPVDMETSVTIPLENKLKGLENVKKIQSVSAEGLSSINIEFVSGTDIDLALRKVKDQVDEAMAELPNDLDEDPSVFEVNFSELPIVVLSLTSPVEAGRLKEMADDIGDAIETIPGILEVEVSGGREREIRVEVFPEKLAYYGIPIQTLERTVMGENANTSAGALRLADGRIQLQVPGKVKNPNELFQIVVGSHQGQPVHLKDVATVRDSFKEEAGRARLDGQEAVSILVKKRAGENIIAITDAMDRLLAELAPTWPLGTRITKLMDKAKDIRMMVADLENNLVTGLLLVVLVLPLAMGLRNAILVALAIPFSMLLSYCVLFALGITLNMVVLFSLTLALGMLVDNAIVIVENIFRFASQGVPRVEAAMRATSEVAYPVIGSTLTTLAAFLPMLFWPGIMGEFMQYLPLTCIIALSASLFVALVINPALAAFFIQAAPSGSPSRPAAGEAPLLEQLGPILSAYRRLLAWALDHRLVVLGSAVALVVLTVQVWLLLVGLDRPVEFFPAIDPKTLYVNLDLPEGADLELADRVARAVEMAVADERTGPVPLVTATGYQEALAGKEHRTAGGVPLTAVSDLPSVRHLYARTMANPEAGFPFDPNAPNHIGVQFLDLVERPVPTPRIAAAIRERVALIPGAKVTVNEASEGPPTGAPINIEISGPDFEVLGLIARRVREVAAAVPFVEDIRDDFIAGAPTIRLEVDRQRAALAGLSTQAIGAALRLAYNGSDVSTFHEQDEEYDITVQLPEGARRDPELLRTLMVPLPDGRLVPLSTLTRLEYGGSMGRIVRIDNQRTVTVKANVDESRVPGPVARAQVERLMAAFEMPPGYRYRFTGEFEFQQESEDFLAKAFIVALFLVFLVLVAQFNSIAQPFIIMTSVLLSLGGAFFGLVLHRMSFGIIMTGVGVISLAGVVVNNAIVLLDYTNQLKARGLAVREALLLAGCTRLRPVLLTAVTTILGLIPMVTGISVDFHTMSMAWVSESSQWWRSMAVAVIWGLAVATLLTLLVVPCLYSLVSSASAAASRLTRASHRAWWGLYERLFGTTAGR